MRRLVGGFAGLILTCGSVIAEIQPGDLAVIAYRAETTDAFAWVALRDLPANTVIHFTNSSVSNGWFRWTEHLGRIAGPGPLTWTSTNQLLAGTVISWVSGTQKCWNTGLVSGGAPQLSTGGDQLFAFTGSIVSNSAGTWPWVGDPRGACLIFGLNFGNSGWDNVRGGGTDTSFVPDGLSCAAGTAVHAGSKASGYYCGPRSGTPSELLAAISVSNNWVASTNIGAWPTEFLVKLPRATMILIQ